MLLPSPKCYEVIKHFEGCKLMPYICPANKPTIGWGHLITADEFKRLRQSGGITQKQADQLLQYDVYMTAQQVDSVVRKPLTQHQFDALVDFTFNLGIQRLRGSTLLTMINRGQITFAADQFKRWVYGDVKGVPTKLPGLIRRREADAQLYRLDYRIPLDDMPPGTF